VTHSATHEEVLVTIRQIIRRIDLYSKKLEHVYGLTGPQLLLLKELGKAEEMPVGHLARHARLSHPTVTGILDRLEKRGLIVRTRSAADKRRVLVSIAEPGIAVLAGAPSLLEEQFVDRFQQLQPWEQTLILSSLQRVAAMMGAEEIDAASILFGEPLTESAREAIDDAMEIVSRSTPDRRRTDDDGA
jgi:DNA-binding MarR family transcriptional regulator